MAAILIFPLKPCLISSSKLRQFLSTQSDYDIVNYLVWREFVQMVMYTTKNARTYMEVFQNMIKGEIAFQEWWNIPVICSNMYFALPEQSALPHFRGMKMHALTDKHIELLGGNILAYIISISCSNENVTLYAPGILDGQQCYCSVLLK